MSTALLRSGKRIIFWVDGRYSAEVFNGSVYYGKGYTNLEGGGLIRTGDAKLNSLLQIGVVPGSPGQSFPSPDKADLLYSNGPRF